MAALEAALVRIPLAGGLAQKVDARVLPAGSWAALENLVQEKEGGFRKRYGFGAESDVSGGGGQIEQPANLGTFRGQPWTVGDPPADSVVSEPLPTFYQRDGGEWQIRSHYEFARQTLRRELIRPPGTSFFEQMHRAPSTPRARVAALWVESDSNVSTPAAASKPYYRVVDAETGLETVPRTQIVTGAQHPIASCLVGTRVIFAQLNGANQFVVRSLDLQTLSLATLATVTPVGATAGGAVDLCRYDATNFLFAYRDGNAIVAQIRNATTGALGATVTSGAVTAATNLGLAFLAAPGAVWLLAQPGVGGPVGVQLNSTGPTNLTTSGVAVLTMASIASPAARLAPVAFDLPGTGPVCVACLSGVTSAGAQQTEVQVLDSSYGAFVTELVPWVRASTKPLEHRGRLFTVFQAHAQVAQTATGPVDVSHTVLCSILPTEVSATVRPVAVTGRLRTQWNEGALGPVPQLTGNVAGLSRQFDVLAKVFVDVGKNARFGADWSRFDLNPYAAGAHQSQEAVGAVGGSGALPWWFDGRDVVEQGFLQDPLLFSVSVTAGAGSVGVGLYDYYACAEYTDQAGNLHRSAPTGPLRVNIVGANTRVTLSLAVSRLTYKPQGSVLIHVFRTLAGPLPDVYRLTSVATAPRNTPSAAAAVVTYLDVASDATVAALGLGFLYTGGELPARTPPSSTAFLAHRGKAYAGNADARGSVFSSKPFPIGGGRAPEFADELETFLADADGPVTALAPLDEAVAAFTETRVYLLDGDGPVANGQGEPYSVDPLPSEHGCLNAASIAVTDIGVFFQSSRGICLLGRDRSVKYVGAPVEDLTTTFRIVRSALVDQERRRVLWLCRSATAQFALATILVLHLDTGVWINWFVPTATVTGHCIAGGEHWISTADRAFGRESGSNARDFGTDYVEAAIETPWLHVGNLAGHVRSRAFALVATRLDVCRLAASVMVDFNAASTQDFDLDLGAGTRVVDPDNPRVVLSIAQQKHSVIKLRLVDKQAAGDAASFGRGLDWASIEIEMAGKRGFAKTAAGNRS